MSYRSQEGKVAATTLVWREEFATGIEELDDQHRAMFDKANELVEAAGSGRPREHLDKLIRSLHEHAVVHFDCEERHMELRRCAVCAANRLAHREFLRDLVDLKKQFDREGATPDFVDQVRQRVCVWMKTHIMAIDIALRETVDQEAVGNL